MTEPERDALRLVAALDSKALPLPRLVRNPQKRCHSCAFWENDGRLTAHVPQFCRRHAPLVGRILPDEVETVWPETFGNDWCGEYRPHPDLPPQP